MMKIGQGSLAFDSADDARDVEQFNRGAEKRFVVGIEAEHMVAEMFANEKEVTRARAKIENAERRRAVEPQVLRPLDIDVDPISNVFETVDLGRAWPIWIFVPQVSKLEPVDVVQNPALVDGVGGAAEMFERAREKLC